MGAVVGLVVVVIVNSQVVVEIVGKVEAGLHVQVRYLPKYM